MLAPNAYLEWLPGPTIPHRHSRFITHTRVTIDESATLFFAEILLPGRKHHGSGEPLEVGADTESDCVVGVSRLPHDAGLLLKFLGMERHPLRHPRADYTAIHRHPRRNRGSATP